MTGEERSNQEIRALCDAATPGLWHLEEHWDRDLEETSPIVCGPEPRGVPRQGIAEVFEATAGDAEFIAAARTVVPSLLDRVAAVERERDEAAYNNEQNFASMVAWRDRAQAANTQLADTRAQLNEARAHFSAIHEVDLARASAAEARIEAVRAWADDRWRVYPDRLAAALAAPAATPEPTETQCSHLAHPYSGGSGFDSWRICGGCGRTYNASDPYRFGPGVAATPDKPDEATVEFGGQTMTQAQFDAARYPLLAPDPGPASPSDEATWVAPDKPDEEQR